MKQIPLSNSDLMVTVDDDVYDYLSRWKWVLNRGYAKRSRKFPGKKYTTLTLHREIMPVANKNEKVIFKDSNSLNCTRANMMIGTQKNVREHSSCRKKKSAIRYKGVREQGRGFSANIKHNSVIIYLGTFDSEIDAAKAYNLEALRLFGKFAILNDIPD